MNEDYPLDWFSAQTAIRFVDGRPAVGDIISDLHHYTTLEGVLGMVNSNCLWATNYNDLNDSKEIVEFRKYLESAVSKRLDREMRTLRKKSTRLDISISRNGGPKSLACALAHSLIGRFYDGFLFGNGPSGISHDVFISSFCSHSTDSSYEKENGILSQWRGYATAGVAIVFDTKRLFSWMSEDAENYKYLDFFLTEVLYDNSEAVFQQQFPIVVRAFNEYADEWLKAGWITGDTSEITRIAPQILRQFVANACRFKHRAFREEREVRIVAIPNPSGLSESGFSKPKENKPILKRGEGVRYVEIRGQGSIQKCIHRIIIGPGREQEKIFAEVRALVESDISVSRSETPLVR